MTRLPTTILASLTQSPSFGVNTSDFRFDTATRHPSLGVLIGGQTRLTATDLRLWIESRAFDPHADSSYEGWWANEPVPSRAVPVGLTLGNPMNPDGYQDVGIGAQVATWGVRFLDSAFVSWAWRLCNAVDGTTVASGTVAASNVNDDSLFSANLGDVGSGSYLLWVNRTGGGKEYEWPADWSAVTGQSAVPANYKWTDANTGRRYQYDPYWNVGAKPWDVTDARQKALLDLRTSILAAGQARKHPAWTSLLITFTNEGVQYAPDGEYACLPFQVGGGTFDLRNVHINALPGPSLWNAVDGAWILDPRLRTVSSFYTDPDDLSLWIGGMWSSPDGPQPCMVRYDPGTDAVTEVDLGPAYNVPSPPCICNRQSANAVNGIIRHPNRPLTARGVMLGLSECNIFTRDGARPPASRLVPETPGGRSLTQVSNPNGASVYYATENDFAASDLHPVADAYVLERGRVRASAGVAGLLGSCLASWNGRLWGITETVATAGKTNPFQQTYAQRKENTQALCYMDGTQWQAVRSWTVEEFDASRLVQSGSFLLAFGVVGATGETIPLAMRVSGQTEALTIEFGLSLDSFVWRAEAAPKDGSATAIRQSALLVGPAGNGPGIDGWQVSETDGAPVKVCGFWNSGAGEFRFSATALTAAGFDLSALPHYLLWDEINRYWLQTNTLPTSGHWLTMGNHTTYIAYTPNTTLPYDPTVWGAICFVLGSNGAPEPVPVPPVPACTDMQCVFSLMPTGTLTEIFKLPGDGSGWELQGEINSIVVADPVDYGMGADIAELYPFLGFRVDVPGNLTWPGDNAEEDAAVRATFTPMPYGRQFTLPYPASKNVCVMALLPPATAVPGRTLRITVEPMS